MIGPEVPNAKCRTPVILIAAKNLALRWSIVTLEMRQILSLRSG
jgi:hypothetical protein